MNPSRLPALPFPRDLPPDTPLRADRGVLLPLPPEEPLDLEHTFRCGQIFRWRQHGDAWYGPYGPGSLRVRPVSGALEVRALGVDLDARAAWRFLGLDVSLAAVCRRLEQDRPVRAAIDAVRGLRILRQEPWECVACYICSQWNNIPKIELSTERIARAWGKVHRWEDGAEVAAFPPAAVLAGLPESELRSCALGYRCRYLVDSARRIAGGEIDLQALRGKSYEEALAALLRLPGVGRKVADCILLFALDQPHAVPVDVWVRRVIHELYPRELALYLPDQALRAEKGLSPREHAAMLRFAWDRWGAMAGYAQQYLFHARRLGRLGATAG